MDLKRLEDKVDKIADDIGEIKVTLARNTTTVEYHVKRSDIADENIQIIRNELGPIKEHVSKVKGALSLLYTGAKVLAALATIIGCLRALRFI